MGVTYDMCTVGVGPSTCVLSSMSWLLGQWGRSGKSSGGQEDGSNVTDSGGSNNNEAKKDPFYVEETKVKHLIL